MSSLHVDFHTNRAHSNIWLGALLRSGGAGADESEENDSFAVWEGRKGGREGWQRGRDRRPQPSSTKTAITHHGSESRIVPALTLGCYNKTMQGHNVPIHHQHSHDCWGNTSAPPPHPNPSFHNVKFNVQPFSAGSQFYDWTSDEREDATLVDLQ